MPSKLCRLPFCIWPPRDQDGTASTTKMIQVRTRRGPIKYGVLTMLAVAVLELHDPSVFLLLTDFVVCCRVYLVSARVECPSGACIRCDSGSETSTLMGAANEKLVIASDVVQKSLKSLARLLLCFA